MCRLKSLLRTAGLFLTIVAAACSGSGYAAGERPNGDPLQTDKSNLKWYVAASAKGDEGVRCGSGPKFRSSWFPLGTRRRRRSPLESPLGASSANRPVHIISSER